MKRHRGTANRGPLHAAVPLPMRAVPLIEIAENKRILVENHLGITAYGPDTICVKLRRGMIEISGNGLEMLCMSKDRVVICGVINTVRFLGAICDET